MDKVRQKAVIFDIDGCISVDEWRLPMIRGEDHLPNAEEPNRWSKYHSFLHRDPGIPHAIRLLEEYVKAGVKILFVTARPQSVDDQTSEWMTNHITWGSSNYRLFMRQPEDEGTPSPEFKTTVYRQAIWPMFDVIAAYDDREDVIEAYREAGLNAFILSERTRQRMVSVECMTFDENPVSIGRPTVVHPLSQDANEVIKMFIDADGSNEVKVEIETSQVGDLSTSHVTVTSTPIQAGSVIAAPKIDAVIFDLDGCLFDDEWRLPLAGPAKPNDSSFDHERWLDYNLQLLVDEPIPHSIELLNAYYNQNIFPIFVTARPMQFREKTVEQIEKVIGIPRIAKGDDQYMLIMRGNEDVSPSPDLKREAARMLMKKYNIIAAYDDQDGNLAAYDSINVPSFKLDKRVSRSFFPADLATDDDLLERAEVFVTRLTPPQDGQKNAEDFLSEGAMTFGERNAEYKDNWVVFGEVMAVLFPNGVNPVTAEEHAKLSVFTQMLAKFTRFAASGLTHQDSVHDLMVYSAIMESIVAKEQK